MCDFLGCCSNNNYGNEQGTGFVKHVWVKGRIDVKLFEMAKYRNLVFAFCWYFLFTYSISENETKKFEIGSHEISLNNVTYV